MPHMWTSPPHPALHISNFSYFGSHSDITSSGKPSGFQTVISTDDVKLSTSQTLSSSEPTPLHPCLENGMTVRTRHGSHQVSDSSLDFLQLSLGSRQLCGAQASVSMPSCGPCCWAPVSAGCLVIALMGSADCSVCRE